MRLFTNIITDVAAQQPLVYRARYGIIETASGELRAIYLKPWPKLYSWRDIWPVGTRYHAHGDSDHCLLYYNQPWSAPNFLALKYMISTHATTFRTFRAALVVLDRIAALKQSDGLVCDAANSRISDRLMRRMGWEPHCPQRWHRNYIKRFYGTYPQPCPA